MIQINTDLAWLCDRYQALFGVCGQRYDHVFVDIALPVLELIESGDAPYHTVDHTLEGIKVGQSVLEGKQYYEGCISPKRWLEFMVSLLCRDIGYVKGIFERDTVARHHYFDGQNGYVKIPALATGAALEMCHVERSKAYSSAYLKNVDLNASNVQRNIEMTRFPVPYDPYHQENVSIAGLCRAADLIGQLSDAQYLKKLPALFQEFQENGLDQILGYQTAADLEVDYPQLYARVVYPHVKPAFRYLSATVEGRKRIAQLYTNLCLSEMKQPQWDGTSPHLTRLEDEAGLLTWQEAGFSVI